MGRLFGTDGIRGLANIYPMDVATAITVGRASAAWFKSRDKNKTTMLIGQDTRLSGDMIASAVAAGICSAGMNVAMLGIMPTPAIAHLTSAANAAAGVVISASHNPFEDNGIKLFNGQGYKLDDIQEDEIEQLMSNAKEEGTSVIPPEGMGKIVLCDHGLDDYLVFLKDAVPGLEMATLKIVLDCANGATFQAAPALFEQMGAQVIPMFCEPSGININDNCGSQHPEAMAAKVVAEGADLGLAFDGDGDRLIAVDEKGTVLSGDQIMAICANHLLKNDKLKNKTVVSTVMSNMGFHLAMEQIGVKLSTTQVGDRYVIQEMLHQDAVLGGEDSGHIIFNDRHTTGDGLMAAIRLVEALTMADGQGALSELSTIMTIFPQVLVNVDVATKPDIAEIPEIMDAIGQAETKLGANGRVLVRYSGTQSKCRVMVEGPDKEQTDSICRDIAVVVERCLN